MKKTHFVPIGISVFLFSFACGENFTRVEIDVSDSVRKAIETAAPTGKYSFYALKGSFPKTVEELKQSTLFVCGEIGSQVGISVVSASLNDTDSLLFRSIKRHFINRNLISAENLSTTLITSITRDKGDTILVPCENTIYTRDHPFDIVLGNCLREMEKNKNCVLLLEKERSIGGSVLGTLVEIRFR